MPLLGGRYRSPLTAAQLAPLRTTVEKTLPDTCTVRRKSGEASDNAGGWTPSYAAVGALTNVACRVSPGVVGIGGGTEQVRTDRIVADADWVITFPALSDVRVDDLVDATIAEQSSTRTFEVQSVAGPTSQEVLRRVGCREARAPVP